MQNSDPDAMQDTPKKQLKASTLETYFTIYNRCYRKAIAARQVSPDDPVMVTDEDLVDDWYAWATETNPNTANMQRAALIYFIRDTKREGWKEAVDRLLAAPSRNNRTRMPEADSNQPVKRTRPPGRMIPEGHLQKLLATLGNMDLWGARAQWFFVAGVASGARPIEWPDAEWIDEESGVLRIYTAKVKARNAWHHIPPMTFTADDLEHETDQGIDFRAARGSANLPSRYQIDFFNRMSLLNITEDERLELEAARYKNGVRLFRDVFIEPAHRMFVNMHMDSVQNVLRIVKNTAPYGTSERDLTTENIFKDHYFEKVRHTIWRACKKTFPGGEMYSLADTRSTFSANRKALNGVESAARELGHTVTTSREFYAPASRAWKGYSKVRAAPQQAAADEAAAKPSAGPLASAAGIHRHS